ncbi:MAG: hypothetical protein JSV03_00420 [Planctomycetota bacterium]|nr:MAG: hypothetical protein JSV03_00420 [Planctomycetota bacterium]
MTTLHAISLLVVTCLGSVDVSWDTATLQIDDTGRVVALQDNTTGHNYAVGKQPFCCIETENSSLVPSAVSKSADQISFTFPGGASLVYRIITHNGFSLWQVVRFDGLDHTKIQAVDLCNLNIDELPTVGVQLNACYDDNFAAAVMATRINVRGFAMIGKEQGSDLYGDSELWDGQGVILKAKSYRQYGITPASFGILACPRKRFEATIDAFEKAAGLPNPHPGGVWSKQSPWTRQSYLFICYAGERDVDEVITWAKRGGFSTILILGADWSKSHGHHEINGDRFPEGLPSLQRTVVRYREAGFRVGLHFLAAAVYLNDPYVWPVPDPRLVKDAWTELAADVNEKADFIPTIGAPQGFPAEDGGDYGGQGTYIQIGDELIQYGKLQTNLPYGFGDCKRGAAKTKAAGHNKGDHIGHMKRSYGYFLYDLDSTLAEEVIGNVCKVANAIEADMLYFDGSEGLQGNLWYYGAKLHSMYYDRLKKKDTFLQSSDTRHFSWHLNSRMASADGSGNIKGYLDERLPAFAHRAANLLPMDVGWYYVYDPEATVDQFEYVLQKCLGFGTSISVQTSPYHLRTHPEMGPIFDLVRIYDQLRLSDKVPESVRKLLRKPGREYRLLYDPLRFRRIVYEPWREIRELDGKQNVWTVEPKMAGCRLGVQIRCRVSLGDNQKPAAKDKLVNPELKIGDKRVVFTATLSQNERLIWFPDELPVVIPADQSERRKLTELPIIELTDRASVVFTVAKPQIALAEVRLLQDCPEELKISN